MADAKLPPSGATDGMPTVEAPAIVVAPEPVAAPTTTHEENLAAESRRVIAERSAPRTTEEQDRTTASQRAINVMWESTQRQIALSVSYVALLTTAYLAVWPGVALEIRLMAYTTLSNVFFAVSSVYFTRTNHTKIGGIGDKSGTR